MKSAKDLNADRTLKILERSSEIIKLKKKDLQQAYINLYNIHLQTKDLIEHYKPK